MCFYFGLCRTGRKSGNTLRHVVSNQDGSFTYRTYYNEGLDTQGGLDLRLDPFLPEAVFLPEEHVDKRNTQHGDGWRTEPLRKHLTPLVSKSDSCKGIQKKKTLLPPEIRLLYTLQIPKAFHQILGQILFERFLQQLFLSNFII